ncbi:MAG: hypothetical protein OXG89_03280 [bacterium]|nr:hypothetical protein [bacterium]
MNPTIKGVLWAVAAVAIGSWLPLFYLFSHISDDPFAWRSWLLVFQVVTLLPAFFLIPTDNKRWADKARGLLYYWNRDGEPARISNLLDLVRSPAFWMVVSFALDLAFWVWAATLIDPLVVTIIFQLVLIGMVWMAARLGKKIADEDHPAPHFIGAKHWTLMVFSFIGAALVIWSETGEVSTLNWAGIVVALVGAITATGSLWGTVSTGRIMGWPGGGANDLVWNATFSAVAGRVFALPLTILGSILFFPPSEDSFRLTWNMVGLLSLIGVFNAAGAMSHRYSLFVTPSLSIQRIMFFSPVLQMVWLWRFADVAIANPPALLMGTAIVLLANLGWQGKAL